MPTIPLSPFPTRLDDGSPCHVVGVDPDNLPPRFIVMRHNADGLLVPDLVHAVAGVSLDEQDDSANG